MYKNIFVLCVALFVSGCSTAPFKSPIERYENAVLKAQEKNSPLVVLSAYTGYPNSVGGVDLTVRTLATSKKNIKYIVFDVTGYNRVGDKVAGEVRRKYSRSVQITGPIAYGASDTYKWGALWYDSTLSCAHINSASVTFMDGSSKIYTSNFIPDLMLGPYKNTCGR